MIDLKETSKEATSWHFTETIVGCSGEATYSAVRTAIVDYTWDRVRAGLMRIPDFLPLGSHLNDAWGAPGLASSLYMEEFMKEVSLLEQE